nr:MAG TPA: hypothetical protein [Caudoviricetes sp.]
MKSEAYTGILCQSLPPRKSRTPSRTQTRRINGLGTPGKR